MSKTNIQWCDRVWNPVTGCSKISEGCKNCYAEEIFRRFGSKWGYGFNEIAYHKDRLDQPKSWRKPQRVFVCSMGDLFHEDLPERVIETIFWAMASIPQHTYIILTKRPDRMRKFMFKWVDLNGITPNVWLGVSAENQEQFNRRANVLIATPAAKRLVSIEPMLEEIDVSYSEWLLDWVICGAESGRRARTMQHKWAESIQKQCQAFGVPFFYKQGPDEEGKLVKMPKLCGRVWDQVPP